MALTVDTRGGSHAKQHFGWRRRTPRGGIETRTESTDIPSLPPAKPITRVITEELIAESGPSHDDSFTELDSFHDDSFTEPDSRTSTMTYVPDGGVIGSHFNSWSSPRASEFLVRGPSYLLDRRKVPSADCLFPCRNVDLFLTDDTPQNVGSNTNLLQGRLRESPTMVINFRLPWGVLLLYCDIPTMFVPYLQASVNARTRPQLEASLANLSPAERTLARWLLADSATKNQSLKIVPVVVDGPWMVKSVVSGKPALIGSKLPIAYHDDATGSHAPYFEVALDIGASTAARGILSIAKSYTQTLTLNLGFCIQGNAEDELSEQMLTGARLHGIDPSTAPDFPVCDDVTQSSEDE